MFGAECTLSSRMGDMVLERKMERQDILDPRCSNRIEACRDPVWHGGSQGQP